MATKDRFETVNGDDESLSIECRGVAPHGYHDTPMTLDLTHFAYSRSYERKRDDGVGDPGQWKNFEHYRSVQSSAKALPFPVITKEFGSDHIFSGTSTDCRTGYELWTSQGQCSYPFGGPGELNSGLPSWTEYGPDGHFVSRPANLENMIGDSLRVMLPGIKAEMSLLNSLYELKDFKRILLSAKNVIKSLWDPNIRGIGEHLESAIRRWRSIARAGRKATLQEITRKASSAFLGWEFAVKPLISDIADLKSALLRTEAKIADLLYRARRPQRRHFRLQWVEFDNVDDPIAKYGVVNPDIWPFQPCTTHGSTRIVRYDPTEFHAEMEFSYYLSEFQTAHAQLLGHLDALGVNSNPAIFWNALPWTFVIDWVFGVSRWLETMKTPNLEPQVCIRRFLWSVKRRRKIHVTRHVTWSEFPTALTPTSSPMPVITETAYRRQVELPSWSSFMMSGLSSRELILGTALVLANVRRPRNRRR